MKKTAKTPKSKATTASTQPKITKPSTSPKPKKTSALDAAVQVLAKAQMPMRAQELIAAMAEKRLWTSPGGKTPHATLYAAMIREISVKGAASRFQKAERGTFALKK